MLALRDYGAESLIDLAAWNLQIEYLSDQAQDAVNFVKNYYQQHHEQPGYELVITEVGWPKLTYNELPDMVAEKAANVILDRVKQNHINELRSNLNQIQDVDQAIEEIVKAAEESRSIGASSDKLVTESFEKYPDVLEMYEERKEKGQSGYDTPFPKITETIGGYEPGNVHYFCARPSTGKSWCLIINALHLYEQGLDVLFVSPEMPTDKVVARQACIHAKVSYEGWDKGELKTYDEEDLKKHIDKFKDETGIKIIEGDDINYDPEAVNRTIWRYDPDVIIVDSFYEFEFPDTWGEREEIGEAAEWLWRIARKIKRRRIVIAAAQLNRETPQVPNAMRMDNLYGSDKIGQKAQVVYGMFQDDDMDLNRQMGFEQIKCRVGPYHPHFFTNWSLDSMDFDQITDEEAEQGDESDYGEHF
jgi:replicative DNA helicase